MIVENWKDFLFWFNRVCKILYFHSAKKSFKNYSDFITYFIPESVDIKSSKVVITKYKNGTVTDSSKPDTLFQITAIKPLFYVDVLKNTEDGSFSYSKIPGTIVTII